ncbi:extracellular substrate binding-like orphan protein GrrP [Trichothermofontia sp.]
MHKKLAIRPWCCGAIAVLGALFAIALPKVALAETVLEKVARTGILTVGTRLDLIPYAYVDDQGQLVGASMDVVNALREELKTYLGREVMIQITEIEDFSERIPKLRAGEIDISCDTTFTWERDRKVDFSDSYSISGIRLLVKQDSSLGSAESLANRRVGVLPNTLAAAAIKVLQPQATIVTLANVEAGFAALRNGQVDALAGDTIVLAGTSQRVDPGANKLVPAEPLARYGVACMVPENNSQFLGLVNLTIAQMMQGYLLERPETVTQVNRWFGPDGIVPINPAVLRGFFEIQLMTREQAPLD